MDRTSLRGHLRAVASLPGATRGAMSLASGLLLVFVGGCHKDPEPTPLPPAQCAKVDRGSDVLVQEVTCSGQDTDEDGVDDSVDLCPALKETRDGVLDKDGCPDPDEDLDGVVDAEDGCPREKGDPPDGCPQLDTDGDGIPNHLDACPTRPEDKDGVQDADGCPEGERGAEMGAVGRTVWREGIVTYRRGSDVVKEESTVILAEVLDEIDGATDDVAHVMLVAVTHPREIKRRSTLDTVVDRRLAAVQDSIVELGVPASKIERKVEFLQTRARKVQGTLVVILSLTNEAAARRLREPDGGPQSEVVDAGAEPSAAPKPDDVPVDAGPVRRGGSDPF